MIPLISDRIPESTVRSVQNQRGLSDSGTDLDLRAAGASYEIIILQNGVSSVSEETKVREIELPIQYADVPMRKLQVRRRGKGNALNIGIKYARYEFVCVLDADCVLDEHAIYIAMQHFEDKNVSAIGGRLKAISDRKNILTFCQRVEYMKTFNIWRLAFDRINANCLISGAYGIFRKKHIQSISGYDDDTVGEDMELVLSVQQLFECDGKPVRYEIESICYTHVPTTMLRLLRQRDRWQRGLMDCILKHNYLILNPLYGFFGIVAMPYQVLVEFLGPVFILLHFMNLICVAGKVECWFAVIGPLKYWIGVMRGAMPQTWTFYLMYLGFEVCLTCLAEVIEYDNRWYMFITKLPEAIAATALGIMLSVPLAVARLWGMISFPWRRLNW